MSGDQQLRAFIERILRLKEEQDTLAADIREVYADLLISMARSVDCENRKAA